MTTAPIATQAQLEAYLGRAQGSMPALEANRALSMGTSKIITYLGFDPHLIAGEVITLRVRPGAQRMWLQVPQVVAVASIEMRSFGNVWDLIDANAYAWDEDGTVEFFGFVPFGAQSMQSSIAMRVTYDRGWQPLPTPMVDICLELASIAATVSPAVVREHIGGYQVFYSDKAGDLSDAARAVLNRFKQPSL